MTVALSRSMPIRALAGLIFSFGVCVAAASPEEATGAAALRARYDDLAPKLAKNAFGKPLHLISREGSHELRGDVYAIVDAPFATVEAGFGEAANWCHVLILPFNTKHCASEKDGSGSVLAVRIGRKSSQPAEDAYPIAFRYRVAARTADHFLIALKAERGPLGTRNYQIKLEAVPLDAARTFIHLSYSYGFGTMSRLGMEAYLATVAAQKVGFTVVGRDEQGRPVYVGGMLGATERNTMRYYLAIEAYLGSLAVAPEARVQKRLSDWFAATERYPRQLREMDRGEYLAMKQRETRRVGTTL